MSGCSIMNTVAVTVILHRMAGKISWCCLNWGWAVYLTATVENISAVKVVLLYFWCTRLMLSISWPGYGYMLSNIMDLMLGEDQPSNHGFPLILHSRDYCHRFFASSTKIILAPTINSYRTCWANTKENNEEKPPTPKGYTDYSIMLIRCWIHFDCRCIFLHV